MTVSAAMFDKVTKWCNGLQYEQCIFLTNYTMSEAVKETGFDSLNEWLDQLSDTEHIQSIYIRECDEFSELMDGYIIGRFNTQDELDDLYRKFNYVIEDGFVHFCGKSPVEHKGPSLETINNPLYGLFS